jgi:hypothetical protein
LIEVNKHPGRRPDISRRTFIKYKDIDDAGEVNNGPLPQGKSRALAMLDKEVIVECRDYYSLRLYFPAPPGQTHPKITIAKPRSRAQALS